MWPGTKATVIPTKKAAKTDTAKLVFILGLTIVNMTYNDTHRGLAVANNNTYMVKVQCNVVRPFHTHKRHDRYCLRNF